MSYRFLALLCLLASCALMAGDTPRPPHGSHHEDGRMCAHKQHKPNRFNIPEARLGEAPHERSRRHQVMLKAGACTTPEFAALSGASFADAVANASDACLGNLWSYDGTVATAVSASRVDAVANLLRSEGFNLVTNAARLDAMCYYLQIALYHAFYQPSLTYGASTLSNAADAVAGLGSRSGFLNEGDAAVASLRYQWSISIDSTGGTIDALGAVESLLNRWRTNESTLEGDYYERGLVFNLLFSLSRQVGNNAYDGSASPWYNAVPSSLINRVRDLALDTTYSDNTVSIVENAIYTLGNFSALAPSSSGIAHSGISSAYTTHPNYSSPWLRAVTDIDFFYNGTLSDGTVLDMAAIRAQVEQIALPYTYTYDQGRLTFRAAIPLSTAELLFDAIQEVEAQFFRKTTFIDPTLGDPNENLTLVIYGSPADYAQYQPFLYGLSTNNGGIYIETWGTLFTYERTPQESYLTLEELLRHEYVHYLDARYAIVPSFGESPMYDADRLTWYNEGLAEFLVGSTRTQGVLPRELNVNLINNDASRMTISEIVNASYSSGFRFYQYSGMLFTYMDAARPEYLVDLFDAVRGNDPAALDAVYATFANDASLQSGYNSYIDTLATQSSNGTGLFSEDVPTVRTPTSLPGDNAAAIQASLSSAAGLSGGTLTTWDGRFQYTQDLTLNVGTSDEADVRDAFESDLDQKLTGLTSQGANFTSAVAWFGNDSSSGGSSTATIVIEGPYSGSVDTIPPGTPSGLSAVAGDGRIDLSWDAGSDGDLAGYNVYRTQTAGDTGAIINAGLISGTSYADVGLSNGTAYFYRIEAVDTSGNLSGLSAQASATPIGDTTAPAAPTGLAAAAGDNRVDLTWNANGESDLDGYHVYSVAGGTYTQLTTAPISATSYADTGLSAGVSYSYAVSAVDNSGNESPTSAVVSATPTQPSGGPPAAPSGIAADAQPGQIIVTWDAGSEPDISNYEVWRAEPGTGWTLVAEPTSNSYSDTDVIAGNYYYYLLRAVSPGGTSNWSSSALAQAVAGQPILEKVLLVNAHYAGYTTYLSAYTDALDAMAAPYDIWTLSTDGDPSVSDLSGYRLVIWSIGYYYSSYDNQLNADQRAAVEGYLDNDGSLVISGAYQSGYLDSTSLFTNYLYASHLQWDTGVTAILPVSGNPVATSYWIDLTSPYYHAELSIVPPAQAAYNFDPGGGANQGSGTTVFTVDDGYKVTYLGFPFDNLRDVDGEDVLRNILGWAAPTIPTN